MEIFKKRIVIPYKNHETIVQLFFLSGANK